MHYNYKAFMDILRRVLCKYGGIMDLLQKLEQMVKEQWRKVNLAKDAEQKQKLMQVYRQLFEQYKKQKTWVSALDGI